MEPNDKSINIDVQKRKKPAYHYGDLRSALVKAGLELLENRDADEIGLREVARHVGVSATAIYRHFPDKNALLRTLAHEGMERLADIQQKVATAVGGGPEGFRATGVAYVRFAVENPALFHFNLQLRTISKSVRSRTW